MGKKRDAHISRLLVRVSVFCVCDCGSALMCVCVCVSVFCVCACGSALMCVCVLRVRCVLRVCLRWLLRFNAESAVD